MRYALMLLSLLVVGAVASIETAKPYEPVYPTTKEVEVAVAWDKTNTAAFLSKPTHTPSPTMTPVSEKATPTPEKVTK